ncbi:endo alpha-1,4 polygalactosaminidase [Niallia sp. 01092]|uniref:endo alpha-1,4 polygalactosaminidase n=1 Tax=unclassified Niallia TaxID=2837522 RepID=UPI003FD0D564
MIFRRIMGAMALFYLTASLIGKSVHAEENKPLKSVANFKIYYGEATEQAIKELSSYDLVVIEPYAFSKKQIKQLRSNNTKVFGYLSVMELEAAHIPQVKESDYFYYGNQKWEIPQWNTYIMDLSKAHYRNILLKKVKNQIVQKGMDGVFLDTVGDIDDYFYDKPKEQKKFRTSYNTLLNSIKSTNPNLLLIQNWGFNTLKSTSIKKVDAILWEDFNREIVSEDQWSQNWISYFKQQINLTTFTVAPNKDSAKYSTENGFIPTMNENDVYNNLES